VTVFLHAVGFGIVTASIIALSAVALSLQWGVSNIPNFAHGEFLTAGVYGALVGHAIVANLFVDILVGAAAAAIVAWITNLAVIERFLKTGLPIPMLFVVTIGISIVIQNAIAMIWGSQVRTFPSTGQSLHHIGPFLWTTVEEGVIAAAVLIMIGLHLVLRYTDFGKAIRSVADDRALAQACGIKTGQVVNLTWMLAGALAGTAGVVLGAASGSFNPTTGYSFLLVTFSAAVIGGIGQPYGAMIGALIVGIATEVSAAYLPASYKQVFAVSLLVLFLFIRPNGIFAPTRRRA
jgi:branched-subunit amino acid ABC-type transport system permease component